MILNNDVVKIRIKNVSMIIKYLLLLITNAISVNYIFNKYI